MLLKEIFYDLKFLCYINLKTTFSKANKWDSCYHRVKQCAWSIKTYFHLYSYLGKTVR